MAKAKASPEYAARWGSLERDGMSRMKRIPVGHPQREARKQGALARQAEEAKRSATDPRRKAVRLGRVKLAA